jgi:hypothetical protein
LAILKENSAWLTIEFVIRIAHSTCAYTNPSDWDFESPSYEFRDGTVGNSSGMNLPKKRVIWTVSREIETKALVSTC